jgi:hypothetical protein
MPQGPFDPRLALGAGIAQGAQNFITAYQGAQARQVANQRAQQEFAMKQKELSLKQQEYESKYGDVLVEWDKIALLTKASGLGLEIPNSVRTEAFRSFMGKVNNPGAAAVVNQGLDALAAQKYAGAGGSLSLYGAGPSGQTPDQALNFPGQEPKQMNPAVLAPGAQPPQAGPGVSQTISMGGMDLQAKDPQAQQPKVQPQPVPEVPTSFKMNRGSYDMAKDVMKQYANAQGLQQKLGYQSERDLLEATLKKHNIDLDYNAKMNEIIQRAATAKTEGERRQAENELNRLSAEKIASTRAGATVQAAGIRASSAGSKKDPVLSSILKMNESSDRAIQGYFAKNPGMSLETASQKDMRFKGLSQEREQARAAYQAYTGKPYPGSAQAAAQQQAPAAKAQAPAAGAQAPAAKPQAPAATPNVKPSGKVVPWDLNPATKPAVGVGDVIDTSAGKYIVIDAAKGLTIPYTE